MLAERGEHSYEGASRSRKGPESMALDIPSENRGSPSVRVEEALHQLQDDGLDHVYVTTASGVLVGLVIPRDVHV